MQGTKYIGTSLLKPDAFEKVMGTAQYVDDFQCPGMMYGKIVRANVAHALLNKVNTEDASRLPGVIGVFTAADIPGINKVSMSGPKDQPVLVEDRIRFLGEAVAIVVASSITLAEEAAALVSIDYEELPAILSIEEAIASPALIHPSGNLCYQTRVVKGNFEQAVQQADVVITRSYHTPMVEHGYIEPDCCFAEWIGEQLVVWTTTKSVHLDHSEIVRVLGTSPDQIRVKAATIGGSFGGKSDVVLVCATALAAYKTRHPVKILFSREECLQVTTKRHPYDIRVTHAAAADGTLLGVNMEVTADAGPYMGYTSAVLSRAVIHGAGPYNVPNVSIEAKGYYTNNPVSGAMRGFGVPQVIFAHEMQMDQLAANLHLNSMEIRQKNVLRNGQETITGTLLPKAGIGRLLDMLQERIDEESADSSDGAWGIACGYYGNGRTSMPNPGIAVIEINREGRVVLRAGSPDIGQGSNTLFVQIVADVLQIPPGEVNILCADTGETEDSGTTSGTRLTYIEGRAVKDAAELMRDKLRQLLEARLGSPVGNISLADGILKCEIDNQQSMDIALSELLSDDQPLVARAKFEPQTSELDANGQGDPYGVYTFSAHAVKATVDKQTGTIMLKKIIAAYDVGKALNPLLLQAQGEGGTVGGIGYGLFEKILLKGGRVENPNFDTYIIPTSLDSCDIEVMFSDEPDGDGPYGAKGIGEPALLTVAPAIVSSINQATGLSLSELPVTSESVWAALGQDPSRGQ